MARYGTLGGGAAMSDDDIDALIAREDPKSSQAAQTAQQTQQTAIVNAQQQIATATKRAFVTGALVFGGALFAYFHFRDK